MATRSVMKQEKTQKPDKAKVYTEADKNKCVEKLVTARIGLLLRHPFFGNMATRLELVEASHWLPTIATDGRKFYYNVDFVNKLKPKEAEFGFAHEVLHNVFDHIGRKGYRDQVLFNIAADFAVNQICKDEHIGEFPSFVKPFYDSKYRGWNFEKIYDDLLERAKKCDIGSLGNLLDEHLGGEDDEDGTDKPDRPKLTEEEKRQIRDEIKEAMIAAAQSAGKVPEGIRRLIHDFTEPKMDWRQILRMNIASILKSNFSFTRPNRKSQHCGAVLPGMMNEETIDICVSIDMSGSITDKMAKDMLSEVKGIMDEYVDFKVSIWTFDTQVYGFEQFTADNADEITSYVPHGGGGTDFEVNWSFMKENGIEPKRFIMFTDGCPCGGWGDENYAETLFIIHGNDSIVAPFGQTAYYSE